MEGFSLPAKSTQSKPVRRPDGGKVKLPVVHSVCRQAWVISPANWHALLKTFGAPPFDLFVHFCVCAPRLLTPSFGTADIPTGSQLQQWVTRSPLTTLPFQPECNAPRGVWLCAIFPVIVSLLITSDHSINVCVRLAKGVCMGICEQCMYVSVFEMELGVTLWPLGVVRSIRHCCSSMDPRKLFILFVHVRKKPDRGEVREGFHKCLICEMNLDIFSWYCPSWIPGFEIWWD